jgi:hypothetical protein
MDRIFFNGVVLTGDAQSPRVDAVAVRDGSIAAVGGNDQITSLRNGETEMIDLGGRLTLPGFNDSHLHLIGYATNRSKVDLSRCESIEEVVQQIKEFIKKNQVPDGEWIFGWGWNHSLFKEKKMPDRRDLDRASTTHCLAMMRTCCHILAVNTRALEKAGIENNPPTLEGGKVETDSSGVSTGVLKEKAMNLVLDLIPPFDVEALKDLILAAGRDFAAAGLTSVQTDDLAALGSDLLPQLVEAYRLLEAEGTLPLRINLQPLLMKIGELERFIEMGYHAYEGSDFFRIGPLKLLSDGSLGGKTAFLNSPYEGEDNNRGVPVLSREEISELVNLAHKNGMQVASHAIGDASIEMVLETYREANRLYPRRDPRFRVVHASITSPKALEMFSELNALADIQPSFTASDHAYIDQNLGTERASWSYRWKDFIKKGIAMGGGSDCPVESYKPLSGISVAVTRQDQKGEPAGGWYPEQRLELGEALSIYTMGSAYCTFEEKTKGSISPGKLADLVVTAENITAVDPFEIKDVEIAMTIVNGNIVYDSSK